MSMKLSRMVWLGRRLAAMSAREVAHRVLEQTKRQTSKFGVAEMARLPCLDNLDRSPPLPRLPLDVGASWSASIDPELRSRWRRAADRLSQGSYAALGVQWPRFVGSDGSIGPWDWHLDPVSRRRWPNEAYCFDIEHRHATAYGDVKYVWELNRLQHLQSVAALARLDQDDRLAKLCLDQIESWIDANPPFKGINWASNIEVGLRVISILVVSTFLGDKVSTALARKITESLGAHAYWLRRFPSRFSSANNHLIAEAASTFVLASAWPDLPDALAERSAARQILIDEAGRQILSDGVGAEQSPTYTSFTLEFYLLATWVADRLGDPFPDAVVQRLARAGEFLFWITDERSNQPRIGDDDEGRVISDGDRHEADYVSSVLGCVAVQTRRADLAPPAAAPRLRNVFLGSPPAPAPAPEGARSFPVGGYTVLRRRMGPHRVMIVFDHGPLGYLSIAAHGHADALSIWMHIDGIPILVDAGTFLYHAGGRWRDHFRGTPAHNTVEINGMDSSKIAGSFNWALKAQARLIRIATDPLDEIEAEHDGYQNRLGVVHRRRIALRDRTLEIDDELIGNSQVPLHATVSFLVNPDLAVTRNNLGVLITGADLPPIQLTTACPTANADCFIEIAKGRDDPPRGWFSPHFGRRDPANMVRIVQDGLALPGQFLCRLELLDQPNTSSTVTGANDSTHSMITESCSSASNSVVAMTMPAQPINRHR